MEVLIGLAIVTVAFMLWTVSSVAAKAVKALEVSTSMNDRALSTLRYVVREQMKVNLMMSERAQCSSLSLQMESTDQQHGRQEENNAVRKPRAVS